MRRKNQIREYGKFVVGFWRHGRGSLLSVLCGLALSACVSTAPKMLNDRLAVITGRDTVRDNINNATRKTLVKAAAMTLDHGFRYFQIVGAPESARGDVTFVRPGADVTIKLYRQSEINPQRPGVWDAESIAAGKLRNDAAITAQAAPIPAEPASAIQASTKSNALTPKCTVYGCVWQRDFP
jgi:hypothetical protein